MTSLNISAIGQTTDISSNFSGHSESPLWRHPVYLTIVYSLAYGLVFIIGLVGNLFVLIAVAINPRMRVTTNFFISSLALADLLIIIFCVPATLMNNVLNEWYLGNFLCKMSVWINATTVCTSVYTLVAVSADRYFAICHTMRYSTVEPRKTLIVIVPIWFVSGVLFSPYYLYFRDQSIAYYGIRVQVCISEFPSREATQYFFLVANFVVAFLLPLIAIILCYAYIYCAVARRPITAVDRNAATRERNVKIKVTHMMVTVVVLFAVSWLPFYSFFAYVMDHEDEMTHTSMQIMRAVFQWLSLANSCINPLLYAHFSRRFRRAFREILVLPCRKRYNSFKLRSSRISSAFRRTQAEEIRSRLINIAMRGNTLDKCVSVDQSETIGKTTENHTNNLQNHGNAEKAENDISYSPSMNQKRFVMPNRPVGENSEHISVSLSSPTFNNSQDTEDQNTVPSKPNLRNQKRLSLFSGLIQRNYPNFCNHPLGSKLKVSSRDTKSKKERQFRIKNDDIDSSESSDHEMAHTGLLTISLMTLPCMLAVKSPASVASELGSL